MNGIKKCKYGGCSDKLCDKWKCTTCNSRSVMTLPLGRADQWDHVKNMGLSPRDISICSNKSFWFVCHKCGSSIYSNIPSAMNITYEWCQKCRVKKKSKSSSSSEPLPSYIPYSCQQGHSYMIEESLPTDIECPYCDLELEMEIHSFLSSIYKIQSRPVFSWSLLNKNQEYITYNFGIIPLRILIEIDFMLNTFSTTKAQYALDNKYTTIILPITTIANRDIDWRKQMVCRITYYETPKIIYIK